MIQLTNAGVVVTTKQVAKWTGTTVTSIVVMAFMTALIVHSTEAFINIWKEGSRVKLVSLDISVQP